MRSLDVLNTEDLLFPLHELAFDECEDPLDWVGMFIRDLLRLFLLLLRLRAEPRSVIASKRADGRLFTGLAELFFRLPGFNVQSMFEPCFCRARLSLNY